MATNKLKTKCLACGVEFAFRSNKYFCSTRCRQFHHRIAKSLPDGDGSHVQPIDPKIRIYCNYTEYHDFTNTLSENEKIALSDYVFFRLLFPGDFDPQNFIQKIETFLEDFGREFSKHDSDLSLNLKKIRSAIEMGQIVFSEQFDGFQIFRDGLRTESLPLFDIINTFHE